MAKSRKHDTRARPIVIEPPAGRWTVPPRPADIPIIREQQKTQRELQKIQKILTPDAASTGEPRGPDVRRIRQLLRDLGHDPNDIPADTGTNEIDQLINSQFKLRGEKSVSRDSVARAIGRRALHPRVRR